MIWSSEVYTVLYHKYTILINHSTPRVNHGDTCSVVLTFESVDEILWSRDYSNETSLPVLLNGTIFSSIFYKMNFFFFFGTQ